MLGGAHTSEDTVQYYVWDKDGDEDTEDTVATTLFEACDKSEMDQDPSHRGRKRSRSKKPSKKAKKARKQKSSGSSSSRSCSQSSSKSSSSSDSSEEARLLEISLAFVG